MLNLQILKAADRQILQKPELFLISEHYSHTVILATSKSFKLKYYKTLNFCSP